MEYSWIFLNLLGVSRTYADAVGPENAAKYQTLVFLAGSASAEFFADIGLCPFEAVKVSIAFFLSLNMCAFDRCYANHNIILCHQKPYRFPRSCYGDCLLPSLCLQVKVQTVPGYANGLSDGMSKFIQQEGVAG